MRIKSQDNKNPVEEVKINDEIKKQKKETLESKLDIALQLDPINF